MKDAFGNDVKVDDTVLYVSYSGGRSRELAVATVNKVRDSTCSVTVLYPPAPNWKSYDNANTTLRRSETLYVLDGELPREVKEAL